MAKKSIIILIFTTCLSLNFIGCGPSLQVRINNPGIDSLENTNLEGVRRTVNVGEVMASTTPLVLYPSLKLERESTALTSHRDKPVSVVLPTGLYTFDGSDANGQYFKSTYPLKVEINKEQKQGFGGIYIPNDTSTKAAAYWRWGTPVSGIVRKVFVAYFMEIPPHSIQKIAMPQSDLSGFVATLTYGGVAGGQIKFIYREYNDGYARAAFTQEVSLDYKPGQSYAYKSARFIVHNADSIKVEYTTLQSL